MTEANPKEHDCENLTVRNLSRKGNNPSNVVYERKFNNKHSLTGLPVQLE